MTTQTTIQSDAEHALDPFGVLTSLITTLLAPMFLAVCNGDINVACRAAAETVNAYRARNNADLLAVAQIIGFGFAALGSLSLSMTDDISVATTLRLRGNANACNRAAEQNRRALAGSQTRPTIHPRVEPQTAETAPLPEPEIFLRPAAEHFPTAESKTRLEQPTQPAPTKRHQQVWAIAMAKQATDMIAGLPNLPPADRKEAAMRAEMLSSTAHDLMHGTPAARTPKPNHRR